MTVSANAVPLIVAACGMVVYGIAAMARDEKFTIDSLAAFGLYCAGIVVGVYIAIRGFKDTNATDALYLVIFGVGLSLVSLREAWTRIAILFNDGKQCTNSGNLEAAENQLPKANSDAAKSP
jgi:hypothetical protein